MRKSNVLIVEDNPKLIRDWEGFFLQRKSPPYDNILFTIKSARSLEMARATISEFKPIDIVLLDLDIAEKERDLESDIQRPENTLGLEILKDLRASEFTAVIVVSDILNPERVARAFKLGALDIMAKPVVSSQLFHGAMKAWEKAWLRSRLINLERKFELAASQSREEVSDSFAKLVTEKVGVIRELGRGLSHLLKERYLIDSHSDTSDPVAKKLNGILREAQSLTESIYQLRNPKKSVLLDDDAYGEVDIVGFLDRIKENLGPGWLNQNIVVIKDRSFRINQVSFKREIQLILEELILEAIGTYSSNSESSLTSFPEDRLTIVLGSSEEGIEIRIESANGGEAPDIWDASYNKHMGFALAQGLAKGIGAKLEKTVESGRSTIRFTVPVAFSRPSMAYG